MYAEKRFYSRRAFLGTVLTAGGAWLAAGCGGGDGGDAPCGGRSRRPAAGSRAALPPVVGGAYTLVDTGASTAFFDGVYMPLPAGPSPNVINGAGRVAVSEGYDAGGGCGATLYSRPGIWTPGADRRSGSIRNTEPASDPRGMEAFCINDAGETAGMFRATGLFGSFAASAPAGDAAPTVRPLSGTDFPPPDSLTGEPAVAYVPVAINNRGEILLVSRNRVTYRVRGAAYERVLDPAPGLRFLGRMLNDDGVAVGYSVPVPAETGADDMTPRRALLFENGALTDLGVPAGYDRSMAVHRNNAGQVLGVAFTSSTRRAFLWQNGAFTLIGPEGGVDGRDGFTPAAVNDSGAVVGTLFTPVNEFLTEWAAVLWQGGELIDLNTRIAPSSGWTLERGCAINRDGLIVATARNGQNFRAVVLIPAT